MSGSNLPLPLFPAESRAAELLHATDWARTPLGPMDTWPDALRLALGVCMNSRFPMFIWWGESLVNLYNDAYVPILGQRHPDAFGRPAREVWHEIWDVLGVQAEAVIERGEATWNERVKLVMERHGYPEETWFTWSYSPIPDGRGGVGGLFCACTEETGRVLAERERDRLLAQVDYERSQLSEAFARSPVCTALVRGHDYVFEYANARYRELIGGRDPTGLPLREALPELEEQGFIELLDHVYRTGRPWNGLDMPVRFERGGRLETRYFDFVYQPVYAPDGTVNGVLGHGIDVTERRKAEARDRFFVMLEDEVRTLTEADAITRACARLLGEYLDADRSAYADVEADEDTFNLTGDYNRGVPSIVGRYTFSAFGAEVLRLMRSGGVYRVADVERHQPPVHDLEAYRLTQIRAVVCVPVLKGGRLVGAMAVHQATPRVWTDDEVDLVKHVANRCWESIERARIERELRWSERRFRAAVDATSNIFWNCTASGEFVTEQPGWAAFTGQTLDEYRGLGWIDAIHPEDRGHTLHEWQQAGSASHRLALQHRLRRRDGTYRMCSVRAVPIPDETGLAREWVGTHTDISERIEFEQSLQESEARFRLMSDQAPVMIWLTRANGECEYVNQQWLDFTGQRIDEALGEGWLQPIHPEDREHTAELFRNAATGHGAFSVEYRLRRVDGDYRWCVDSAAPRFGAGGEFLGLVGTVIDITERKRMEDTLASEKRVLELIATGSPLHEVLDTLARRFESQSLDGMLCSVLLATGDGRLVVGAAPSLPPEYARMIEQLEVGPDSGCCGAAVDTRERVTSANLVHDPSWRKHADVASRIGLAACSANPIIASDGRVLGSISIAYRRPHEPSARDLELSRLATHLASIVIEKHQLDERLHRSLEAEQQARVIAERASRMKDEFLATLSHELRSPLNAILGWVAIMRLQQALPPALAQGVDVIERNARAQAQIIQDLLDMSSIVSGKVALEMETVSPASLVRSAVETALPAAQAKQIRIDTRVEPGVETLALQGDPNRLQQVMWNLLSNAVKFTPHGGRIEVRLQRRSGLVEIAVQDNGEGIEPGFLPFVFDRFRQADASISRRHGGLGLGLSIVRKLVELHGGTVHVHSDGPGRGATFGVTLPLPAVMPGDTAGVAGRGAAMERGRQRLSGVRVLVVDDDADARLMTQCLLESAGADVRAAASAGEALAVLQEAPVDALVSDIGMPGQDGFELIRQVRTEVAEPGRSIPAVALTAYAHAQDRVRALQAGFQHHLAKPVEPAELIEVIAAMHRVPAAHSLN